MEMRKRNVMINLAGGTAGKESVNYRISLPAPWMEEMGITKEDKSVKILFENKKIIITKEEN